MRIRAYFLPASVAAVYLFLYFPLLVLALFSFNDNPLSFAWRGFTMRWYAELMFAKDLWEPLKNSLIVATSAVLLSGSMGLAFVLFLKRITVGRLQPFFYLALAVPEIVLAVGLLVWFHFFSIPLGLTTLIAAHTLIGLSYAVPLMYARLAMFDMRLLEASLDLGATYGQTVRRIVVPFLMPTVTSASLLVFIISFDEFVLSFFCAGGSVQTLPMYIFAMMRTGHTTLLGAFSVVLLMATTIGVFLFSFLQARRLRYFS